MEFVLRSFVVVVQATKLYGGERIEKFGIELVLLAEIKVNRNYYLERIS